MSRVQSQATKGLFTLTGIAPGNYTIEYSFTGYTTLKLPVLVGHLSDFLDLGTITLHESSTTLSEVVVEANRDAVAETMEKRFSKSTITLRRLADHCCR